jgi:hypothetical protein
MAQQMRDNLVRVAMDRARPMAERVEAIAALQELDDPEVPGLIRQLSLVFRGEGKVLMARGVRRPDCIQDWFRVPRASWSLRHRVLLLDLGAPVPMGLLLAAQIEGEELRATQLHFALSAAMRTQMHEPSVNFPALALQPADLPVVFHRAPKVVMLGPPLSLADHWYDVLVMLLATADEEPGFAISAAILGSSTGHGALRELREPTRGPAWADFLSKVAEPHESDVHGSVATMSFFPTTVAILNFATLADFHAHLLRPAASDGMFHEEGASFFA